MNPGASVPVGARDRRALTELERLASGECGVDALWGDESRRQSATKSSPADAWAGKSGEWARRIRRFLSNKGLDMVAFFKEWSAWVVMAVGSQSITLLVDATKIRDRLAVMLVGIAREGGRSLASAG